MCRTPFKRGDPARSSDNMAIDVGHYWSVCAGPRLASSAALYISMLSPGLMSQQVRRLRKHSLPANVQLVPGGALFSVRGLSKCVPGKIRNCVTIETFQQTHMMWLHMWMEKKRKIFGSNSPVRVTFSSTWYWGYEVTWQHQNKKSFRRRQMELVRMLFSN